MAPNNYSQWIDVLFEDNSPWGIATGVYDVVSGVLGPTIFWLLVLPLPFLASWIKQSSIIIPVILYMTIGSVVAMAAPVEMQKTGYLMLGFGITGLIYHIFKNRR